MERKGQKPVDLLYEIGSLLESFASKNLQEFVQYSNLIVSRRPRISELLESYQWAKSQLTNKKSPYQKGMILIRLLVFQFMVEGVTKQMFRLLLKALTYQCQGQTLKPKELNIQNTDPKLLEKNILFILNNKCPPLTLCKNLKELCRPSLYELRHAIAHHRFYIETQGNDYIIFYQPEKKPLTRENAKMIKASEFFRKMDALEAFWISLLGAYDYVISRLIKSKQIMDFSCNKCSSLIVYVKGENLPTKCHFCGCNISYLNKKN